jgi:hypothetical protein
MTQTHSPDADGKRDRLRVRRRPVGSHRPAPLSQHPDSSRHPLRLRTHSPVGLAMIDQPTSSTATERSISAKPDDRDAHQRQ